MSFTDNEANPAQPEEGQGDGGQAGDSPYSEFLSRINDEEARAVAEEGFKHFDASATKKFQEHAEQRKQWEPFQQLGLQDKDPQSVAWALQVAELAQSDPAAFAKWAADNYGQAPEPEPAQFDEFALQDPQVLEQLFEQKLNPLQQKLEQYEQRFEQQDQARAQQEATQFVEGQMAELAKEHGDAFDREGVELFLDHFTNTAQSPEDLRQAVPRAFEALQALRNKHEKSTFQAKMSAPAPAEGGGVPNMTPETVSGGLQGARAEALKILVQQNRQ